MKIKTALNIFNSIASLSFGILKFFSPFRDWYTMQIEKGGLPSIAFASGIAVEIITGIIYLIPFFFQMGNRPKMFLLILANCLLILIMVVAIIVHLNPAVSPDVLPGKIKPPIIPLIFLLIAIFNLNILKKTKKSSI